jgi:hypothetical protein
MINTHLSHQERDEYVARARKNEMRVQGRKSLFSRIFVGSKKDFYYSIPVFIVANISLLVPALQPSLLCNLPYITGVLGYFLGLLIRPGLDIICILCLVNAFHDQSIGSDDRYIFNSWLIFVILWWLFLMIM